MSDIPRLIIHRGKVVAFRYTFAIPSRLVADDVGFVVSPLPSAAIAVDDHSLLVGLAPRRRTNAHCADLNWSAYPIQRFVGALLSA